MLNTPIELYIFAGFLFAAFLGGYIGPWLHARRARHRVEAEAEAMREAEREKERRAFELAERERLNKQLRELEEMLDEVTGNGVIQLRFYL